ncbi:chlorohydrolase [Methanofervidicoccus sp. A16]|uniref:amidohydrolase family protein n=1 Tax=Methanofervidicoccus sp. A16 TaxID=2607662 RepID=UPI00118C49DC|nr:amidohydrolase family protein [Methanofervidicoccus sp. A16]AXI25172.1 chlorohydrolase [Methanofervidicoccus sp. A16]
MYPRDTTYLKSHFLYGEDFQYRKGILVIEDGIIKGFTGEHIREPVFHKGVVIPPLINAHTHIGDNIIKDIGINKTLDELVKPPHGLKHRFLNACSDEELINGMVDGLEELRNNGITHFCDFREGGLKGVNLLREAYSRYNREFPHPIILGRPTTNNREDLKNEIREILKVADGIGLSGCNEYSDEELKTIRKLDYKIFSIHANEHRGSIEYSKSTYGMSEIERIVDLKLHPTFIIHATYTTPYEAQLLREYNIPVVVCPRANASFNVGLPDIKNLLDNNVLVGLGTDNFMANSPSIFKEMDFIYKIYHIDPKEILKFSTINNCRILGLEGVGLIEEGYKGIFTFIRDCPSIRYSKNITASVITRCEKGDIVIYGGNDDKGSY